MRALLLFSFCLAWALALPAVAGEVRPGHAPSPDPPGEHGMLVVGSDVVYLSHLPMFHTPHDYQLVFEATLEDDTLAAYRRDNRLHPGTYYTLVPTARWVLPDTIREGARFDADLYRGHFERGGTPIKRDAAIVVRRIVHFRRFDPGRSADPTQWIGFGRGREHFLAHRIEGAPDMDQVVQVSAASAEGAILRITPASPSKLGALEIGSAVPAGRVQRVIYTEYGDLAQ